MTDGARRRLRTHQPHTRCATSMPCNMPATHNTATLDTHKQGAQLQGQESGRTHRAHALHPSTFAVLL